MRISTLGGSKLALVALLAGCALGPVIANSDGGRYIIATNVPTIDVGDAKLSPATQAQDPVTNVPQDPKPTRKSEPKDPTPTPTKSDPESKAESQAESTAESKLESKYQTQSKLAKSETVSGSKTLSPTETPKASGQSMITCVVENTCGSDAKCVRRCSHTPDPDVNLVQRTAGCLGRCNTTEIATISLASCYQKCIDGIFVDYPVSVPKLINVQGYVDSHAPCLRPGLVMLVLALVTLSL
ncbi:hypothetical protein DSO57_1020990 [Entomophthora muscae]|uniref:Uncharacterized protein n=1 Tax=Entomophthora muscae TaxID=34485 RepID=A0ACC2UNF7_9FUNG|nr:hypothetical protein DSO57_1020990 [Entomophthora muscae]